jgi:predicted nucleotidyltransferase
LRDPERKIDDLAFEVMTKVGAGTRQMIHGKALPVDIEERLGTLGAVLSGCSGVVLAYVFGGAGVGRLTPLSDVDVAVYLEPGLDPSALAGNLLQQVTRHLGTDEVDLIVLNTASTALLGRILQTRHVICDRRPFLGHQFESRALREFFDFRLFERRLLDRRYGDG